MIRRAAGRQDIDAVVTTDAVNVPAQVWDLGLWDQVTAAFRAEDAMNEQVGKFVGHGGVVPEGTRVLCVYLPGASAPGFPIPCLRHWDGGDYFSLDFRTGL